MIENRPGNKLNSLKEEYNSTEMKGEMPGLPNIEHVKLVDDNNAKGPTQYAEEGAKIMSKKAGKHAGEYAKKAFDTGIEKGKVGAKIAGDFAKNAAAIGGEKAKEGTFYLAGATEGVAHTNLEKAKKGAK
eukprot:8509767-Ditylum_brightwellii.AAC.1